MRRHRADGNQADMIEAFRRLGATVLNLAQVGGGCPDLAISVMGRTEFVEIKRGAQKLRKTQLDWRASSNAIVHVAHTLEDVERIVSGMSKR